MLHVLKGGIVARSRQCQMQKSVRPYFPAVLANAVSGMTVVATIIATHISCCQFTKRNDKPCHCTCLLPLPAFHVSILLPLINLPVVNCKTVKHYCGSTDILYVVFLSRVVYAGSWSSSGAMCGNINLRQHAFEKSLLLAGRQHG
jgi:hypothetical protein